MSENITHTAIVDDCARLVSQSPGICPIFQQCWSAHPDIARLGGITRSGDVHNPRLLAEYRRRWPTQQAGDRLPQKLAFVLGWLSHRAADRQFKPVFRQAEPGEHGRPYECSIYHDVLIFREIYLSGQHEPYHPSSLDIAMDTHPAAGTVAVREVESLLRAMWQRMLICMHTFIPDESDVETWLDHVLDRYQPLYVDLQRYADAYSHPDAAKMQRFIVDMNFYDRTDPLLRFVRAVQQGTYDSTIILESALKAAETQSLYARALARAFRYISAASDFFLEKIGEEELQCRLDIGLPEY